MKLMTFMIPLPHRRSGIIAIAALLLLPACAVQKETPPKAREIGARIGTDEICLELVLLVKDDGNLIATFDDVVVDLTPPGSLGDVACPESLANSAGRVVRFAPQRQASEGQVREHVQVQIGIAVNQGEWIK